MVLGNAARSAPLRYTTLFKQVGEREGQILLVPAELLAQRLQNFFLGVGARQRRSHIAESGHAPLADQAVRLLRNDAQHSVDAAAIVGQWTVGEGMVGLFRKTASLQEEQEALVIGGLAGGENGLNKRADIGPNLGPDFICPHSQCAGMFDA